MGTGNFFADEKAASPLLDARPSASLRTCFRGHDGGEGTGFFCELLIQDTSPMSSSKQPLDSARPRPGATRVAAPIRFFLSVKLPIRAMQWGFGLERGDEPWTRF